MAREEVIKLAFEADLSDLRKELGKLPEIGSKEAKAMVKALEKQYKRAERAAKKSAKAQKSASGKVKAGFESAKQAAEGFGGAVGGAAGGVEKFARSMFEASSAIGPVGVALVAAGLAVTGVGIAAFKASQLVVGLIGDAEELATSLEPFGEAGVFAPVPTETMASIQAFNDSMDGLVVVADKLKVELAGELAAGLDDLARKMVVGSLVVTDLIDKFGGLGAVIETTAAGPFIKLFKVLKDQDVVAGALASSWDGYGDAVGDARTKADELLEVVREQKEKTEAERKEAERAAAAKKAQAAAEREYKKAVTESLKAIKDIEKARSSLAKITESTTADLLSDEQKIESAFQDRVDAIADVAMESKDAAGVKEALDAAEARRIRELSALDEERTKSQKQQLQDVAALESQLAEQSRSMKAQAAADGMAAADAALSTAAASFGTLAQLRIDHIEGNFNAFEENIEKEAKKRRRNEESEIAGLLAAGKISEQEADRRLANLDALEKADKKKVKTAEKFAERQALKAFKGQKAAQKAQAIIDAARAAVALIPGFAFLGPGAPVAAAAVAGTALGTQLAVINAQSPPDFPVGGPVGDRLGSLSADHVPILATPAEGVVTPRGMDDLGREGLASINEGRGGSQNITLQVGADVVARAVMSSPDLAGRIAAELQAVMSITSGRVPVYGKG